MHSVKLYLPGDKEIAERQMKCLDKLDDFNMTRPTEGVWGQRHLRHIKQNSKVLYLNLLTRGKKNGYLADINKQTEEMFFRLVKQMSEREGVTEQLKADNQMEWVG